MICVDLKEHQYLDSGVWNWVLGFGLSFGLIGNVLAIIVVCCWGWISAIADWRRSVNGGCGLAFTTLGFYHLSLGFRVCIVLVFYLFYPD